MEADQAESQVESPDVQPESPDVQPESPDVEPESPEILEEDPKESATQALQIVDFDANYSTEHTNAFIKNSGITGCDYLTLAIIGCQSTGKSTMMNMLFGTDFNMLDAT